MKMIVLMIKFSLCHGPGWGLLPNWL